MTTTKNTIMHKTTKEETNKMIIDMSIIKKFNTTGTHHKNFYRAI